MRSTKQVIVSASAGVYPWLTIDHHLNPTSFSLQLVKAGTGDIACKVEGSLDVVNVANSGAGTYNVETSSRAFDFVSGLTDSFYNSYADKPLGGVRLNIGSVSGAASLTFTLLQSGN